jgi:hypothetical protein
MPTRSTDPARAPRTRAAPAEARRRHIAVKHTAGPLPPLGAHEIPLGRWAAPWWSGPTVEARYVGDGTVTCWWTPRPPLPRRAVRWYSEVVAPQLATRTVEALGVRGRALWVGLE